MECHVCLEAFDAVERRPKSLPCGHTFCLRCLEGLQPRRCPLDQKVFRSTPEKLADNYSLLQLTTKPAAPAAPAAPRLWCRTCGKEADEVCVDEHSTCSLKKARTEEAAPLLEELQQLGAGLDRLGQTLDDAAQALDVEAARATLQRAKDDLAAASGRLQDKTAADGAWTEAKQAAAPSGLTRSAAQLAADLANPSFKVAVQLGEAGGVAWSGEVRPAESAAARLLLCQLACHGGLLQQDQPPGEQVQQEQANVAEQRPVAPRWQERPNEITLRKDQLTAKIKVGSRVRRGSDWNATWTDDGTPPGPGTVTKVERETNGKTKKVWVTWDRGAPRLYTYGNDDPLRPVVIVPLKPWLGTSGKLLHVSAETEGSTADTTAMTKVLSSDHAEVRGLVGLDCRPSPPWSHKLLQQVAPNLESLQFVSPEQRHLDVVLAMPQLEALCITGVTAEHLRQVAQMASLRRLQVHCPFEAPLPVQELPATRLQWLCCGVYPLAAALALVRASADTLEELQLVAASTEPYGCPDLAAELRRCGLKKLKKLWLLRETAYGEYCRHDADSCGAQKVQLYNMFLEDGIVITLSCSVCG